MKYYLFMKNNKCSKREESLRNALKVMRKTAGLNQSQLAQKLDKPQSFVSKYESGERKIDAVELIELIQCLDESPETFIKKYCSKLENT